MVYEFWVGEELHTVLKIEIDPDKFGRLAEALNLDPADIGSITPVTLPDLQLAHLGLACLAEIKAGDPSGKQFTDFLGLAVAVRLVAAYSAAGPAGLKPGRNGLTPRQRRQVLDFMETHVDQEGSLEMLAAAAGLTTVHRFNRVFKASFGMPPHRFLL